MWFDIIKSLTVEEADATRAYWPDGDIIDKGILKNTQVLKRIVVILSDGKKRTTNDIAKEMGYRDTPLPQAIGVLMNMVTKKDIERGGKKITNSKDYHKEFDKQLRKDIYWYGEIDER